MLRGTSASIQRGAVGGGATLLQNCTRSRKGMRAASGVEKLESRRAGSVDVLMPCHLERWGDGRARAPWSRAAWERMRRAA